MSKYESVVEKEICFEYLLTAAKSDSIDVLSDSYTIISWIELSKIQC